MLQSIGQRLSGSRAPKDTGQRNDAGFTLNELVWALFLLGVVATAALGLFLNGMTSVSNMQRQQAAASLASTALDQARAVTSTSVSIHGTSGLIKGRSQAAVLAQWDEINAFDPSLTSDMTTYAGTSFEAYDVAPGMTQADQWVPIQVTQTVDNQEYTVDTLVGACYRLKTATGPGAQESCASSSSSTNDERMYRVRVVVRWDTGSGEPNLYTVSTLVDPSADAVWNTALMPFAVDDEYIVPAGGDTTDHNVLSNDTYEEIGGPTCHSISILSPPAYGSVVRGPGADNELIHFTSPLDVSGTVTFTYSLCDAAGQVSAEPGTVMLHVVPKPGQDSFSVEPNTTTALNETLLDNDIAVENISDERETKILPFLDSSVGYFETEEVTEDMLLKREVDRTNLEAKGVFYDDDGNVWLQAPDDEGAEITFFYYLVDTPKDGVGPSFPSPAAEVSITLTSVPLDVSVGDLDLTATSSSTWHTLNWRHETENSDDVQIKIVGVTNGGDVFTRVDGDSGPGAQGVQLEFQTLPNNLGEYEIEYLLVSPGGNESETGVFTVTVAPFAPDPPRVDLRRTCTWFSCSEVTRDLDLLANAIPSTEVRVIELGAPTCGTLQDLGGGQVRFRTSGTGTCVFTYRVESTGDPSFKSHAATRVTIRVTN